MDGRTIGVIGLLTLAWLLATFLYVWLGRRQRREGRGTLRRLWGVAAAVSSMQIVPGLAGAFLLLLGAVEGERREVELMSVAAISWLYSTFAAALVVGPPLRFRFGREPLPEVTEGVFWDRYWQLCRSMNLSPPVVRMLPSLSASMETMAWVGGLPAPSVVVTDGLVHRLEPDEANSILAHELGHLANYSLWWYTAVWLVLGPLVAVLLTPYSSPAAAVPIALAITFTVRNMVSRFFEIDSDFRGARATGFGLFAEGLEKVHKGLPYEQTGFWPVLAFSVSTHPLLDVRLGALADKAPAHDPVRVPWSPHRRRASLWLSSAIMLVWSAWLAWLIMQSRYGEPGMLQVGTFLTPLLVPLLLLQRCIKKSVRQQANRQAGPSNRPTASNRLWLLLLGGVLAGVLMAQFNGGETEVWRPSMDDYPWLMPLLAVVILILAWMNSRGAARLNQQVLQALMLHRWDDVLRLAEAHPQVVSRHAHLRHNVAIAKWMLGKEQAALDDLARAQGQMPKLKQAYLTRGSMFLDQGDAAAALDEAEDLQAIDPQDIEAWLLAARACDALGKPEQAEQHLNRVDQLVPGQAGSMAVRASIAARRGNLATAAELFERAEAATPALPLVRLLAAEFTLEHGPLQEARRQVAETARLVHAAPLCLLQHQLARLEEALTSREQREATSPVIDGGLP